MPMTKTLHRFVTMLLVLALVMSMLPTAFAAETETTVATESTVETMSETVPEESTAPEPEQTEPSTEATVPEVEQTEPPTEETAPETQATVPETTDVTEPTEEDPYSNSTASEDDGIMTISGNKVSGITLLNLASPYNYTLQLPKQVYVKYVPAGTSTAKTAGLLNIGWHYYSYNGVADKDRPIYCIEPLRDFNAGSPGNYMDQGVDVWGSNSTGSIGSNAWYALSTSQRSAIALVLQYSELRWDHSVSVTTTPKGSNPNFGLRNATQVLIYEIVTNLRDASTFVRNDSNGYTDGSVLYDAFKDQISDFISHYNGLVADVQGAMLLPSFCSSSSSSAPTITLATDSVLTWVQDSNGVLQNFTFPGDDDIYFYVYNELCIEHFGNLNGTRLYSCYRTIPSTSSSSFNVFYGSSANYQTCVALNTSGTSTLTGYFKLYAEPQTGNLSIRKSTSDGKNLSGWQFSLYSNAACTNLIGGPYTSDSSGRINVSGLNGGQSIYVKEIGHKDASVNAQYVCSSTNPQKVTIVSGSTVSVTFNNNLRPGNLNIVKVTSDGKNLAGWQFNVYSDAACTSLLSGPHASDATGKISVFNLAAGQTVYVKEIGHQDSSINALYVCDSTNPQAVTIAAGGTVSVTFNNRLNTGSVKLVKQTNTGKNLDGWQIGLYTDETCTSPIDGSPFTTGSDGTFLIADILPQRLYAKELSGGDDYWLCDPEVKTIDVVSGQTASVVFTNTHYGRIAIQKHTNTGNHLGGWTFVIRDSEGNIAAKLTTDENGYAVSGNLPLGRFTVQEEFSDDDYWTVELGTHDVTVEAGKTVTDEWTNIEQGLGWFLKETNTEGSKEGWEITVYSDEGCTQVYRTAVTNEEGKVGLYMEPGVYWAKETGDTLGRFDSEYWQIDTSVQRFEIKPHTDTTVTFRNSHFGRLKVIKVMEGDGSVEGWQFKVTDSSGKEIEGSPFTSSEDGTFFTGNISPGLYMVEELIPDDSPYTCVGENPKQVAVVEGETAEVTFTNALRPGKIVVRKVDNINNEPLAGATFLLEWRAEGGSWAPIQYSESESFAPGTCSNPNVVDGCLITGEEGLIQWDNLHPDMEYRLSEVEAPEGYVLLEDYAYEGQLPEEDLEVSLRVVNCPGFTLPETGAASAIFLRLGQIACIATCLLLQVAVDKKKRR